MESERTYELIVYLTVRADSPEEAVQKTHAKLGSAGLSEGDFGGYSVGTDTQVYPEEAGEN